VRRPLVPFVLVVVAGLALAAALAFFVGPEASTEPDGLSRVATDAGFADTERPHPLDESPTAGYTVDGVGDERLGTGLSGVIGVAVTFVAGAGLVLVVRRARARRASAQV
jgi:hypothetical protein